MTHSPLFLLVRFGVLVLVALATHAGALRAQSSAVLTPLERIVADDGSLALPEGAGGSYDPTGWVMTTSPDGAPRFYRRSEPALLSVPGDEHWDSRFGPPGVGGPVHAVAAWKDQLFIGGHFRVAGTAIANNVVAYNTTSETWELLGSEETNGVGGPVYAMAATAGNLYVGGTFESAGGVSASGIARWDIGRQRWSSLGGGVASVENTWVYPGHVYAIAADSQSVFVGGMFLMADADTVVNLARWDIASQSWSAACKTDVNRTNGIIRALALHNGSLYVGGYFTQVADVLANRVARWDLDANTWHSLADGFNSAVFALGVHEGRIVAGGMFTSAGGRPVARVAEWSGSEWRQLGHGFDLQVQALHSDGTSLYAGGLFTTSGRAAVNGVARWSGGGWSAVGLGIADDTLPLVRSLVTVGGKLYAGGNFTAAGVAAAFSVAQWDTVWSALGARRRPVMHGTDAAVHALAIDGDDVYIGGDFTTAGGIPANRIARWSRSTGLWFPLGTGIDGAGSLVRAITLDAGGNVYVGGIFPGAGGLASPGVAYWDGGRWHSMAGGVSGETPYVFALAHAGGTVYVGGAFDRADTAVSPRIAAWSTATRSWSGIAGGIRGDTTYTYVTALAADGARLAVGGEFTMSGTTRVNRLLQYTGGSNWSPVGRDGSYGVNATVSALALDGAEILVGGDFTRAGGLPIAYFARWDGVNWLRDSAIDGPVRTFRMQERTLVVGGEFTRVGSVSMNRVAALDLDNGAWRGFRSGTNGPIYDVEAIDDEVYAGGSFSSAGGARTANVAQWRDDNWSAMGSDPSIGINDTIFAMVVRGTDVFVGGRFKTSGGIRTNGIARWDGESWRTVGSGFGGANPVVRSLALAPGGDLYAGGSFTTAGRDSVFGVARWDGTRWRALGTGVRGTAQRPASINAIAIDGDAVYVGGELRRAGGVDAMNIARWTPSTSSWSALGTGLRGPTLGSTWPVVNALAMHDGALVATGRFDSAGSERIRFIARWDGAAWRPMGTVAYDGRALSARGSELVLAAGTVQVVVIPPGTPFLRVLYSLLRWNGTEWTTLSEGGGVINALTHDARGGIIAGGYIGFIGDVNVNGVARWNGGSWENLGSGLVGIDHLKNFTIGSAYALASVGDDLYVGGNFIIAGRKPSYYFAHWNGTVSETPLEPQPVLALGGIPVGVAPNPVGRGGSLRIEAQHAIAHVRVFDMLGAERLALTPSDESRTLTLESIGTLPAGAYLVRVETSDGVGVGRIVVR